MSDLKTVTDILSAPFGVDEVKWVVSHSNDKWMFFVPYIEKEQVISRFDKTGCPWNCSQEHLSAGYMKATLSINIGSTGETLSRDGVGHGDAGDLKAAETDSVKRAGRMFGIGHFPLRVAWPSFKEVPGQGGKKKKVPMDATGAKPLYGNDVNEALLAYLKGANVSPHDEKVHWIKFNQPNDHATTQTVQQRNNSTKIETAKKLIATAESVIDFKTSHNIFKDMKGVSTGYPILLQLWCNQLISVATRADEDTLKALGKMAVGILDKDHETVKSLRSILEGFG